MFIEPVEGIDAEGWVMSSESCGFLSIGARYVREVSKIDQKMIFIFYNLFSFYFSENRLHLEKLSKSQNTV